jgi:hypothetical protein
MQTAKNLRRFLKHKTALSTPVGSLIILMAAVVLCTTVVFFAINVTSSQVQKEKLYIASSHVWYVDSGISEAAVAISNTGPTDAVLTKIDVKGLQVQWNGSDNFVVYCKFPSLMPGDLSYVEGLTSDANTTIPIAGSDYEFTPAQEGLTIPAGTSIAFYIMVPNRVVVYDLSEPLRMVITTTQGVYVTETVVQTAT